MIYLHGGVWSTLTCSCWEYEIEIFEDPSKATLGQLESRDLPVPSVADKV